MAAAQTGEFAVQVPGPVVHDAWEIQDELQDARSGKRVNRSAPTDGNSNSPGFLRNGAPAGHLTREDFAIFEDGRPQQISVFERRMSRRGNA